MYSNVGHVVGHGYPQPLLDRLEVIRILRLYIWIFVTYCKITLQHTRLEVPVTGSGVEHGEMSMVEGSRLAQHLLVASRPTDVGEGKV